MNDTDRAVIKRLIDAFFTKGKIKQFALKKNSLGCSFIFCQVYMPPMLMKG